MYRFNLDWNQFMLNFDRISGVTRCNQTFFHDILYSRIFRKNSRIDYQTVRKLSVYSTKKEIFSFRNGILILCHLRRNCDMQQPTDIRHSSKEQSIEESEQSRKSLEERLKNRVVDKELLHRAWHTVHKIAAMLYEDFCASKVAVFGSLAEGTYFSKWSDIDIVVWGIPNEIYLKAVSEITGLSPEFRIELVKFENCKGVFRERLQNQIVPINKDKVGYYQNDIEFDQNRKVIEILDNDLLIQRISDGYEKVKGTVQLINHALHNIKDAPDRYRRSIEIEIARYLYDFYKQLENIFERIAREFDQEFPTGEEWHKILLQHMCESTSTRNAVFSQETCSELQILLGFRHVFLYIYGDELDYNEMLINANRVNEVFPNISNELEAFIDYLKKNK
ncbi:hypothetical protein C6497_06940 [Candidatus Poribacteria bacterium]|nr:MAG: hypothetical protein C6497_06940 [Candidatus Poribacteria bacterium]